MKVFLLTMTISLSTMISLAQSNTDLRIANKYANNGQCDKAVDMYETFENKLSLNSYYTYYLKCLLSNEKNNTALQLVKKAQQK